MSEDYMLEVKTIYSDLPKDKQELLDIVAFFASGIEKIPSKSGRAKHVWRIEFGGANGWREYQEIRQDHINPLSIYLMLKERLPAEAIWAVNDFILKTLKSHCADKIAIE
jgi:hypothetical protein